LGERLPDAMMPNRISTRFAVLLLSTVLAGCAQTAFVGTNSSQPGAFAWDGAGEDPNLSPQKSAWRSTPASGARQASDGSAADEDAELAQNLVICRGCATKPTPSAEASAAMIARQ
jgi:hypothetical protein